MISDLYPVVNAAITNTVLSGPTLSGCVLLKEKPVFFVFFKDFCLQRLVLCYNYKVDVEGM